VYLAGLTSNAGAAFIDLSFDKSGQTALGPRQVAKARALLGDQGDKLTAVGMHSAVYYDLVERKAIDYITNSEARLATAATGASTINAVGGSIAAAYGGDNAVPLYMGLRVIVSDDLVPTSTNYPVYFFTQGAIASGEQMGMQTETDRDILAKSDAMSIDLHYCYHPVGANGLWVPPTQHRRNLPLSVTGLKFTSLKISESLGPPLLPTSEVTNHGFSF
jgi:hypothetical protein